MRSAATLPAPRLVLAAGVMLMAGGCMDNRTLDDIVVVAAGNAHSPTVAMDDTGTHAFVAWVAGDSAYDVMLARRTDAGEFDAPVRVNNVPGDAAPHAQAPAQVAVGPDGSVYVVWQNNTLVPGRAFPASDLRFARSTDGGQTFEPTIFVNDDAGGAPTSHTFHNIVVADDGAIYVSWIDGRARTAAGLQSSGHGAHGMTMSGAPDPGAAAAESAASAPAAPTVADPAALGPQIRVARSSDGGRTFGPSVVVAEGACPCCRTSLAIADGNVYIAWRDVAEGSIRDVVVARSRDGGSTWSAPTAVHSDGWRIDGCPHAGPALAATADGRIHVAWYTGAPDRPGIHYASADSTLAFGASGPLLTGEWVPPSLVALAGIGTDVIAAWDDRRADVPVLRVGNPLDAAAAIQVDGVAPAVAANGASRVVAWLRNDTIFAAVSVVGASHARVVSAVER